MKMCIDRRSNIRTVKPTDSKSELIKRLLNSKHTLFSMGVKSIGLFGSFVRDEQADLSDIDLLVEFFPQKKSFDHFMELSFFLEELLGRKVEIVTPESLSPYIGPHILKEVENVVVAA